MTDVFSGDQGLACGQAFTGERSRWRNVRTAGHYDLSDPLRRFIRTKYLEEGAGIDAISGKEGTSLTGLRLAQGGRGEAAAAPDRRRFRAKRTVPAIIAGLKVGILGLTLAVLAWLALAGTARADTLLSQSGYVFGTQAADFSFTAPGPGTLDVDLVDYGFPSAFASLTLSITSATDVLGAMSGPGTGFVDVGAAGTYYAHLLGTAKPSLNVGFYGLNISFASVAPVPLPASFWLVLAGIAATAWSLRRRKPTVSRRWETAAVGSARGG